MQPLLFLVYLTTFTVNRMPYQTFATERLYLRPVAFEDDAFIFEVLNTPKFKKFVGDRQLRTVADARNYIKTKMHPQLERLGYSSYTVIRKEDGVKLGICGLYDREGLEGIDIGFSFLPQYEGQGYAFEAANCIKEAAFHDFGIKTLKAITVKENLSSQKLIEKLGLKSLGTTTLPNDAEELLLYSLSV